MHAGSMRVSFYWFGWTGILKCNTWKEHHGEVIPGELLCADTTHNNEIVSLQFLFGKQTVKETTRFEVFTAVFRSSRMWCWHWVSGSQKFCRTVVPSEYQQSPTQWHNITFWKSWFLCFQNFWCVHQTCHIKSCRDVTQA